MKLKEFFKRNYLAIVIFLLFLIIGIYFAYNFKNNLINNEIGYKAAQEFCSIEENKSTDYCINFFDRGDTTIDTLTVFYWFIDESPFQYLAFIGVAIVCFLIVNNIDFKNKDIKRKDILLKILSIICFIPFLFLIPIICSILLTNSFDYTNTINAHMASFPLVFLKMNWKFFLYFELSLLIISAIYGCFALISYKISHNKYLAVIISIIILLLSEGLLNGILKAILLNFNVDPHMYLTVINIYNFNDVLNPIIWICIKLGLLFLLSFIVGVMYKKEKIIKRKI